MSETNVTVEAPEAPPPAAETMTPDQTAALAADVAQTVATEIAAATPPAEPDSSLTVSALSDAQQTQLDLLRQNIELLLRRVDQQGQMLASATANLASVTEELQTTMELMQQVIGQQDESHERVAVAAAALVQLEARLTAALTAKKN